MKLKTLFSGILLLSAALSFAQENNPFSTVKKVGDFILNENPDGIRIKKDGTVVTDFSKLPQGEKLLLASRYKTWEYWNGVLNKAMLKLYEQTNNEKYKNYSLGNYAFIFDNYELLKKLDAEKRIGWDVHQLYQMGLLDHCGSMASGLIEVYKLDKRNDYLNYLNVVGDYMLNKEIRLADGTFARLTPFPNTVWLDDLYMSIPFLARMGKLTNDRKYFDLAARQVIQFTKYMYDTPSGLYYHCYYDDTKEQGVAHWGRTNGWSIVAQANLLEFLPKDHLDRTELIRIFKQQILGFARHQSETGLWHQIHTSKLLVPPCLPTLWPKV